MSDVSKWKRNALDPYLNDYDDPIILVMSKPSKIGQHTPPWARVALSADQHQWCLANRDDVVMFTLTGDERIVSTMEVDEFIKMMNSYTASKELFTGIIYYTATLPQ